MFNEFKSTLKDNNNKNFTFVKIKRQRICNHCKSTLARGTECLTVNPKNKDRFWVCDDCVISKLNVIDSELFKSSIAFNDEGGYLAALDFEAECIADYISRAR